MRVGKANFAKYAALTKALKKFKPSGKVRRVSREFVKQSGSLLGLLEV
jgi:hypothetical protein